MEMRFQTRSGVPDRGWGSRHGMMGYQTEDGVPVRGGVATFMSHQSGILHSLIFLIVVRRCAEILNVQNINNVNRIVPVSAEMF